MTGNPNETTTTETAPDTKSHRRESRVAVGSGVSPGKKCVAQYSATCVALDPVEILKQPGQAQRRLSASLGTGGVKDRERRVEEARGKEA